jgi:hypothetical protein
MAGFGIVLAGIGLTLTFTHQASWLTGLGMAAFGGLICWSGAARGVVFARLCRPEAEVEPAVIRPGEPFVFRYRQRLRTRAPIRFTVALVLREVVEIRSRGEVETKNRDHLVRSFEESGLSVDPGEVLQREYELAIPEAGTAGLRVGDGRLSWVVKVRVQFKRYEDVWHEYDLPVAVPPRAASPPLRDA